MKILWQLVGTHLPQYLLSLEWPDTQITITRLEVANVMLDKITHYTGMLTLNRHGNSKDNTRKVIESGTDWTRNWKRFER